MTDKADVSIGVHRSVYIGLIVALISISAFIRIPNPVMPFTLQMFVIFLIPLIFGPKISFYGVLLYIVLGLIGLPIFSSGGGISYVIKPSFGYLIGSLLGVLASGKIVKRWDNILGYLFGSIVLLVIVYLFGVTYLFLNINHIQGKEMGFITAIKTGALIFILPDLIKLCFAILLTAPIRKIIQKI